MRKEQHSASFVLPEGCGTMYTGYPHNLLITPMHHLTMPYKQVSSHFTPISSNPVSCSPHLKGRKRFRAPAVKVGILLEPVIHSPQNHLLNLHGPLHRGIRVKVGLHPKALLSENLILPPHTKKNGHITCYASGHFRCQRQAIPSFLKCPLAFVSIPPKCRKGI
jgi:hypothetical protein